MGFFVIEKKRQGANSAPKRLGFLLMHAQLCVRSRKVWWSTVTAVSWLENQNGRWCNVAVTV